MLEDDEELISAHQVTYALEFDADTSLYEHFITCCETLGIMDARERMSEILICDYILANHDRHMRNFGVIRNVNTLECRMAPIFDSGSCLWNTVDVLNRWENTYRSKPFDHIPERQLALVDKWDWYDLSSEKSEQLIDFIKNTLSGGPLKNAPVHSGLIINFVSDNINTVGRFKEGHRDHPALI